VREALFSILVSAGAVKDAHVLDLYAGTGSLAFEALSRGAARATLVESSRRALSVLRANITALGLGERADLVAADVGEAFRRIGRAGPFDIVLIDPPWSLIEGGDVARTLSELGRSGVLAPGAWVALEHSCRSSAPESDGLVRLQMRRYGDTAITFYKPAILAPPRKD
jgi:16S rRNA (guanine966-N2)-methyltransferase